MWSLMMGIPRPWVLLALIVATTSCFALPEPGQTHQGQPPQAVLGQPHQGASTERCLIELSPGDTRWVTEEEKWALKREGRNFFDLTYTPDLGLLSAQASGAQTPVKYPDEAAYEDELRPLLKELSTSNMKANLERLTSFYTRYYKSQTGVESAEWLLGRINETIVASGAHHHGASVRRFEHPWGQPSLIATIPGRTNRTVIIGAHHDSINLFLPSILPAPGADDDGSGTVTILEALRVLLLSPTVARGQATNTIEFHWYAAEEGGLLGSAAVFAHYARPTSPHDHHHRRHVIAMLQQDMTGYIERTIKAGRPESIGVVTDHVDPDFTAYIIRLIETYCTIPPLRTTCGYACSDHASAHKVGYPSAFVIEAPLALDDPHIHTADDLIAYLDFDHMRQYAVLSLALAVELGRAEFEGEMLAG